MGRIMSFDFGLEKPDTCFKRKNRWLFKIPNICADGVSSLPPNKAARPNISFKVIEAQHLNETIYFPGKPEWKPINLTLYDIKRAGQTTHVIFEWLKRLYDPKTGEYKNAGDYGFKIPSPLANAPIIGTLFPVSGQSDATLELYDGCGEVIEKWVFENIWPESIEFGDLDMQGSDIITCDLTLRYDRAYLES